MRFMPGASGNPNGRPPKYPKSAQQAWREFSKARQRLTQLLTRGGSFAIARALARHPPSDGSDIWAARRDAVDVVEWCSALAEEQARFTAVRVLLAEELGGRIAENNGLHPTDRLRYHKMLQDVRNEAVDAHERASERLKSIERRLFSC